MQFRSGVLLWLWLAAVAPIQTLDFCMPWEWPQKDQKKKKKSRQASERLKVEAGHPMNKEDLPKTPVSVHNLKVPNSI